MEKIPAKQRRWLSIGLIATAFIGILWIFVSGDTDTRRERVSRDDVVKEIFTGANVREQGLQGLTSEVSRLRKEIAKMQQQNENLNKRIEKQQEDRKKIVEFDEERVSRAAASEAVKRVEEIYNKKLKNMQNLLEVQQGKQGDVSSPRSASSQGQQPLGSTQDPSQLYDVDWENQSAAPAQGTAGQEQQTSKKKKTQFRVITAQEDPKQKKEKEEEPQEFFIPAGSILSGTLLTGLDAPTAQVARSNPYPVVLRLKKEAILPNRHRADVRECFLVASGYGDLSSERAYLRSELISCVREDGGVIEAPIDMFASGEDGKAGVRGRLVSKQGQFLARALMAGFMDGFSDVFSSTPVPTLVTNSDSDSKVFQQNFSQQALESAGIRGVGDALEKLADFYMDMAANIFPIIEIDAGREIDFLMTRGTKLKMVSGG
ncbi:hypothetical protein GSUB_16595 (plasmid) [Geoalkalibacter subterraneus]|uniref:Conjugal transfer protein TraB n=2 Tax=Geoalkalibacter subterraneus TaxID=483547 RepID=A0A0B5FL60_9BACT|nr:hypothetical protein GSUB_16595 [Geoalkalibacter subterraneus]